MKTAVLEYKAGNEQKKVVLSVDLSAYGKSVAFINGGNFPDAADWDGIGSETEGLEQLISYAKGIVSACSKDCDPEFKTTFYPPKSPPNIWEAVSLNLPKFMRFLRQKRPL